MNENVKRSAESILMLYAHFTLSLSQTSGASLTNCESTIKINSPNIASKVSSEFLKKMWLIEYRIFKKYHDFYHCGKWLHHHNSQGFHVRLDSMKQSNSDDLILQVLKAIAS